MIYNASALTIFRTLGDLDRTREGCFYSPHYRSQLPRLEYCSQLIRGLQEHFQGRDSSNLFLRMKDERRCQSVALLIALRILIRRDTAEAF